MRTSVCVIVWIKIGGKQTQNITQPNRANNRGSNPQSQLRWPSCTNVGIMNFLFSDVTKLSVWGQYWSQQTYCPVIYTVFVHDNEVPWSVRISFRIQTQKVTWNRACATVKSWDDGLFYFLYFHAFMKSWADSFNRCCNSSPWDFPRSFHFREIAATEADFPFTCRRIIQLVRRT